MKTIQAGVLMSWGEKNAANPLQNSLSERLTKQLAELEMKQETSHRLARSVRIFIGKPSSNNRIAMETALEQFDEVNHI